jgi:hypothetical protein
VSTRLMAQVTMKCMAWIVAIACVATAPAHAGQILQTRTFDLFVATSTGIHENGLTGGGSFDSFGTATQGFGIPVTLTDVLWHGQGVVRVSFDRRNISDSNQEVFGRMEFVLFLAPGASFGGSGSIPPRVATVSASDTCAPGDFCSGSAEAPFAFDLVADLNPIPLATYGTGPVFGVIGYNLLPAGGSLTFQGSSRGHLMGTTSLTYIYVVSEPSTIAVLVVAFVSFARRRKLW